MTLTTPVASAPVLDAPKLRADLVVTERLERGEAVFVIKAPRTDRYFQVGDVEHALMGLMDGNRSIRQICDHARQELQLDVQPAVLKTFLRSLRLAGCLVGAKKARSPAVAGARKRGVFLGLIGNLFYWRFVLLNPDRRLDRLMPWTRAFFTPTFVVTALLAIAAGGLTLALGSDLYLADVQRLGWLARPFVLAAAMVFTIAIHETAHGLTCKYHGGRVKEMGFLLIFLTFPCLFTNVSDAWMFPRKSQRLWVTASGPLVEALLWSFSVFVWRLTEPGSPPHDLALGLITVSGLGMFMTFNPLLKFDAYYFLSDWLEIPNLRDRSFRTLGVAVWRSLTGAAVPPAEKVPKVRWACLGYGILALAYTATVLWGIVYFIGASLHQWLGTAGLLPIGLLVFSMLWRRLFPIGGWMARMAGTYGALRHQRFRLLLLLVLMLAGSCFYVEAPLWVEGTFSLEAITRRDISSQISSFVSRVNVREGQRVKAGEILIELDVDSIRGRLAVETARLHQAEESLKIVVRGPTREEVAQAKARVDVVAQEAFHAQEVLARYSGMSKLAVAPATVDKARSDRDLARDRLAAAKSDLAVTLAGRSPEEISRARAEVDACRANAKAVEMELARARLPAVVDGVITTPRTDRLVGTYVTPGVRLLEIEERGILDVDIQIPERECAEVRPGQPIELKMHSLPESRFSTSVLEIAPGVSPASAEFNLPIAIVVRTRLRDREGYLMPKMTGRARIDCGSQTIASLAWRRLRRWIRDEFWL